MTISDQLSRSENDALIKAAVQRARNDRKLVGFLPEISTAVGAVFGYLMTTFLLITPHETEGAMAERGLWTLLAANLSGLFFGWVASKIQRGLLKPQLDQVIREIASNC